MSLSALQERTIIEIISWYNALLENSQELSSAQTIIELNEAIQQIKAAASIYSLASEAEVTAKWNELDTDPDEETPKDGTLYIRSDLKKYGVWDSTVTAKGVTTDIDIPQVNSTEKPTLGSSNLITSDKIKEGIDEAIEPIKNSLNGKSKYHFLNPESLQVVRILQFDDTLNFDGNEVVAQKVDTQTNEIFENTNFAIEDLGKSYKLEGWKSAGYSSIAGLTKVLNHDISGNSVGDKLFVHFILKTNGLNTGTTNSATPKSIKIGENLIPIVESNSDTTITALSDGYSLYKTEYELTASDISHGTIDDFELLYYASSNNATDSLELLGYEIYIAGQNLYAESFNNKIDDLEDIINEEKVKVTSNTDRIIVIETAIPSLNGKIINNSIQGMDFVGNYNPPFISRITTTAKDEGLTFVDDNTPVFIGTGFQTTASYGSNAGIEIDLTGKSLSDFSAVEGNEITLLFYMKKVSVGIHASQGFYIGSNKIEVQQGADVTITDMGNDWNKYEVKHTLTASDITENSFGKFLVQGWNSTDDATRLLQSIQIVEPLIYVRSVDVDDTLDTVSRQLLDAKMDDFIKNQLPYKGKKIRHEGDSISNYNAFQPVASKLLDCDIDSYDVPGRSMKQCFTELTTGDLDDVELVTIWLCVNDYLGNAALGTNSDDYTVDSYYGRIKKAIKTAYDEKPTIKLGFITALPTKNDFGSGAVLNGANGTGTILDDYVEALKIVCSDNNIPVLDLFKESNLNDYNIDTISPDGIHPTYNDYEFLKENVANKYVSFVNNIIG